MGRFDGIIIVSDIDGTFLGKRSRMVPENLRAIERFQAEGGLFTIATGREIMNIDSVVPNVGEICNAPVIACNGACIWDPAADKVVHEEFLPEPEISVIAEAARTRCPHIPLRISVGREYWTERIRPITQTTFHNMLDRFRIMPYEAMPHGNWYKLGWDGTAEELEQVRGVLEQAKGDGCLIQYGHHSILEVQSVRGTKGAMLNTLKKLTGRENAVIWAIGDYENDYVMLSMADRCAMPSNGLDSLRSIPGMVEVCGHDEGAIAGLIDYIDRNLTADREE